MFIKQSIVKSAIKKAALLYKTKCVHVTFDLKQIINIHAVLVINLLSLGAVVLRT